jgi:hypothetical protein
LAWFTFDLFLGLSGASARTVNIAGRIARVVGCELDINAGEFRWLASPAKRIRFTEVDQMVLGRASGDL